MVEIYPCMDILDKTQCFPLYYYDQIDNAEATLFDAEKTHTVRRDGITDFILPSMTQLVQESFYCGPSPTQMHVDNVTQIGSRFWEYYGGHLADMYIRGKTCEQIKAMAGFPFRAGPSVRFHGLNGIVLGNGTIIHE